MSERWIVIPRWEELQHRDAARSAVPTWIKLYTELGSKEEFLALSFHQRGVLVGLWLEYARSKRQLRDSTLSLTRRLGQRVLRRDLKALNDAGFIRISASKPARKGASVPASLEKKRVEKRVVTLSTSDVDSADRGNGWVENLGKYTGCRYVRGSHAVSAVYDVLGTEKPPSDWPHERPTRKEILKAIAKRQQEEARA